MIPVLQRRMVPMLLTLGVTASGLVAQDAAKTDVTVEIDQFGVGSVFRPGDIAAIRLSLTSALDEPTPCWVQWEVPNAEGDIAEYGRSVTLSLGPAAQVWLYAPVPPQTNTQTVWTVRVFEERDGRRRRELGGTRISPSSGGGRQVAIEKSLIGVVGQAKMGLDDYGNPWAKRTNPPGAHEETRVVSGIRPDELPDRWEGLKAFEAIVWSDALPQAMRVDAANALREYVRRGGHLVITLPEAGNPWGLGARGQTWLDDLLISRAPRKDEAVALSDVIELLSKTDRIMVDFEMSLRVFSDSDAGFDVVDNHYEPLLAMPDGRVVAVRRTVGFGRVTLLGIDLSSRRLASMRIPQADAFWNRVLGRRSDTPQAAELMAMDDAEPPMLTRSAGGNELIIGDERVFEPDVNKAGRAELGLFAAVILFFGYFLLAGPGVYFVLRQRGLARHSWLAFAGVAALFTAVAWGGVRLLREHQIEYRHVTFLDHIARRPDDPRPGELLYQRGISWGALYEPSYGTATISIDSEPKQRDLLLTWAAPRNVQERFPNVDRYVVDVGRNFSAYDIPIRATATQLYANWLGALDPDWGGTLRVDPDDPIRVETGLTKLEARLEGTLLHELPSPLTNVRVIWVSGTGTRQRRYVRIGGEELPWVQPTRSGELISTGHMWISSADSPWYPQTPLSLSIFKPSPDTNLERNIYERYIRNEEGDGYSLMSRPSARLSQTRRYQFIEMLSMFHQLDPPKYLRWGDKEPDTVVLARRMGRELDLSQWFTGPCLIVIGYLQSSPTPVPIRVDGRAPASDGLTVVRWVYPLPPEQSDAMIAEG